LETFTVKSPFIRGLNFNQQTQTFQRSISNIPALIRSLTMLVLQKDLIFIIDNISGEKFWKMLR